MLHGDQEHRALPVAQLRARRLAGRAFGRRSGRRGGAAAGSVDAGRTKSATCAACHGVDGNSVTPDWPMLAGQHASYIVRQLRAFKNGERTDVTMKPFADLLSEQDMLDVAAYFEAQTPTPKGADPALVGLGQQIYRGGVPGRDIAACIACHGPEGTGNPLAAYPRISGQHAAYIDQTAERVSHRRPPLRRRAQSDDAQRRGATVRGRDPRARKLRAGSELVVPKKAWLLALLALGACGGPSDPAGETDPALDPQSAAADGQAGIEPELVATDPAGVTDDGAASRWACTTCACRRRSRRARTPTRSRFAKSSGTAARTATPSIRCSSGGSSRSPSYVNFVRVPAVWNPMLQMHARAFYTAEALGKGAEMHSEFFREIHERRNALDTEAKLQEFFGRFGVDAAAFKSAFDSFEVQAKLQRADELSRRYRIDGVPTMVVNGKYTTDAVMVGSYEELLALVDELVAAEREAR